MNCINIKMKSYMRLGEMYSLIGSLTTIRNLFLKIHSKTK